MTKKRTSKAASGKKKVMKRKIVRHTPTKRSTRTEGASGWEIVPFVIAVVVAIVVIVQSIDSATESLPRSGGAALRTHLSAGCDVSGAALRKIRGSERGVERGMALLEDTQHQVDWDCSTDPHGRLCNKAKENLQEVNILVQEEINNLEQVRIEACL
ncbi:MAG TPA: hypothetical protein VJB82_01230 [Candidatus Peribacterales bacterium]|nr:hypothetical protein [Candidatus Peribacterales bacterium]